MWSTLESSQNSQCKKVVIMKLKYVGNFDTDLSKFLPAARYKLYVRITFSKCSPGMFCTSNVAFNSCPWALFPKSVGVWGRDFRKNKKAIFNLKLQNND